MTPDITSLCVYPEHCFHTLQGRVKLRSVIIKEILIVFEKLWKIVIL